jgi:predicted neuraminidase
MADIEIKTNNDQTSIQINNIKPLPTQPTTGFLVRINPITIHDQWLLPMYHENPCYGQIMKSTDTKNWRTSGHIGLRANKLIQPSLWWDGETLHSLSRDMSGKGHAWYSCSKDLGESWSTIQPTNITNDNNSIAVINDNTNTPYVIWNEGERRHNLMIGKLDGPFSIKPIKKLNNNTNASYPNYCIDNNKIHIVNTEYPMIAHHIIDKQELELQNITQETIIIDKDLQTRK